MPGIPRPARQTEVYEYQVVWNGVHHGCDDDLFNERDRLAKQKPSMVERREGLQEAVREALARWTEMETRFLASQLGASRDAVSSALYHLRERGEVLSLDTGRRVSGGWTIHVHRLTPAGEVALERQRRCV